MQYYLIKPEVAGGLGEHTLMDSNTHPPIVHKLHYTFDGWSGDVLLTSFPCYIVTSNVRDEFEKISVSGISFSEVEISKSEFFDELFPELELPKFLWMKVYGIAGSDDLGIAKNLRLVVSKRVLDIFDRLGLKEAIVTLYE